ncbi:MAG: PspA/IM30 family protein [Chloroflexi bacterium]|nr:MAG: PspA/IM30 family protein [Chloroflexota bacterium]TME18739.1 MAG: PspA/IM30 family protein [Chloroflexota bacterium]
MSVFKRMSDVVQQKLNAVLDKTEDPNQALDFAYQKQIEALQQVRRNVADVLTAEKRLELQAAQLRQSADKLNAQAQQALQQGREDLARLALTRAQTAQVQLGGLDQQIEQMKEQEQKLELTAQKLQAKVEAFRTQKETIKAQYSAAQASTKIGEAVTGLSEQMADVSMMVDRAQEKTTQMQARAAAIDQLVDTGTLDQIGAGSADDIQRQLDTATTASNVDAQLALMKAQMAGQLPSGTVVRIQGEDQFRLAESDRAQLDAFDKDLVAAINGGDEAAFKGVLTHLLEFVRNRGQKLPPDQIVKSDIVVPSEDMSLEEAKAIMATGPVS